MLDPFDAAGIVATMREHLAPGGTPRATKLGADLIEFLCAELRASQGYLRNAKIDLETGCSKATAIRTIQGGIDRIDRALGPIAAMP